jgi:hypothetical protein
LRPNGDGAAERKIIMTASLCWWLDTYVEKTILKRQYLFRRPQAALNQRRTRARH